MKDTGYLLINTECYMYVTVTLNKINTEMGRQGRCHPKNN